MNHIQHLTATIEDCIASVRANSARAHARFQELREQHEARTADGLPKWRRRPRTFETLPSGEVIVHGQPHSVRTQYLRPTYGATEVAFLQEIVSKAPRETFTAEQAFRWLESRRHGRIIPRKLLAA